MDEARSTRYPQSTNGFVRRRARSGFVRRRAVGFGGRSIFQVVKEPRGAGPLVHYREGIGPRPANPSGRAGILDCTPPEPRRFLIAFSAVCPAMSEILGVIGWVGGWRLGQGAR